MNKHTQHAWLAVAMGLASGAIWAADAVTGTFTLDGKDYRPSHAAAFKIRDQFNPRSFDTFVMLTPVAVNVPNIRDNLDPYSILINDDAADGDWIGLSVKSDGKITMNARMNGTQYLDTTGKIMGQQGSLKGQCSVKTETELACEVSSIKPVKTMDGPAWETKLTFNATIHQKAPGKAIAKNGGEAGKAVMSWYGLVKNKNHEALKLALAPGREAEFNSEWNTPEENQQELVEHFDRVLPKKGKITAAEELADGAVNLEMEGEPWDGTKMLYLLQVKKIDGSWRQVDSATVGMLRD